MQKERFFAERLSDVTVALNEVKDMGWLTVTKKLLLR
jgi:hypothetical protein